ncbi:hypothetical protein PV620_30095 [Streptomyces sp. ME02-6978a]|uniref:hypothetical protein n=1 Tax=unclassified Streptomyces TaxID=2593676 RepID=UPI0029BB336C|nr:MULTISPECIES: hypothetical protein [unclassified Streptomyces]MDX3087156.1 hypothetical protein [Streptomyces sp. ME12-02E]MDX3335799.1 hypothetical protein [Streptomyces sp. ME02-6978a]
MSTAARARATPGRAPTPQQVTGLLVVDTENVRARYECYRPGCPQRREGPVFGPAAVQTFATEIRGQHMAAYHGEHR